MRATAPRSGLNNDGPGGGRSCASRSAGPPLQPMGARLLCRVESLLRHIPGQIKRADSSTLRGRLFLFFILRSDRIIVGEVRGAEICELLTAYNSGHAGSMSTGHGNTARDMLLRMETMLLMGMDIPLSAIRRQIASGIDILVHLGRMRDKTRKVLEIAEITGFSEGEITTRTLYAFEEDENSTREKVSGKLEKKGELCHVEKLEAAGFG